MPLDYQLLASLRRPLVVPDIAGAIRQHRADALANKTAAINLAALYRQEQAAQATAANTQAVDAALNGSTTGMPSSLADATPGLYGMPRPVATPNIGPDGAVNRPAVLAALVRGGHAAQAMTLKQQWDAADVAAAKAAEADYAVVPPGGALINKRTGVETYRAAFKPEAATTPKLEQDPVTGGWFTPQPGMTTHTPPKAAPQGPADQLLPDGQGGYVWANPRTHRVTPAAGVVPKGTPLPGAAGKPAIAPSILANKYGNDSKGWKQADLAYQSIPNLVAHPSAMTDYMLAHQVITLMSPRAQIRQGVLADALKSQGVPANIAAKIEDIRLKRGARFDDTTRQIIANMARGYYKTAQQQHGTDARQAWTQAELAQVNPKLVVTDWPSAYPANDSTGTAPSAAPSAYSVTTPDGKTHTFPSRAALAAFKTAAGIK